MSEQSYEKHARFVPVYHFVTLGILGINFIWSAYFMARNFSTGAVIASATAGALVILFLFARVFPLGVQDRVIRLEERMRLQLLLPDNLKAQINEFSKRQLIAMRFASDGELPDLAARILEEGITDAGAIKKLIKQWRPDTIRI